MVVISRRARMATVLLMPHIVGFAAPAELPPSAAKVVDGRDGIE